MRGPADLLAWRSVFPAVERTTFLGAHTLAPLSRPVRAAVDRFLDRWEEKPSAERLWFEEIIPEMRRAEALFAGLVGADPDEVVLVPSVSVALSAVASCIDFTDRPEVVVSRREFPTDSLVWLAQEQRGARVVWVDGSDEAALAAALGPYSSVVSASRVSYLDASVLDARALAAACRDALALCVLDDYHGVGVVPIDVHDVGCDVLVGGPLKYLLGGPGVAFLYVRRDLTPQLEPAVTGWFAQQDFFAFDGSALDRAPTAQRFALGTPPPAAIFAAAAGMEIVAEVGVERIRARVLELTDYLIEAVTAAGYRVRTPLEHSRRGGFVAVEVDDAPAVLDALLAAGVIVDERHGFLRVSPQFFSSEDDLDAFVVALRRVGR